ncbi:DUF4832 domain-containing protein [Oryzobacter telluris]|uniref:DUF4832 domain-containing protein n=1 Tax=Oryzobacter telluris TaxID=3149179 RepID=UPI00370D2AA2
MSTPAHRRLAGAVAIIATALVAALAAAPAGAADPTPKKVTFTPGLLASSTEIPNSLRGQYKWMGYAPQPASWSAPDLYYRDQVYWGRLEPQKGAFDFKWIEDGLSKAGAAKSKFGFRVMAYCPGCWMEYRTDKVSFPAVTPSFVPLQEGTKIPDWNSEAFLSGYESLMAELGRRYGNDPRLGYVDVGGYGKYGEWWVDYPTTKITEDNALRLVRAVNRAFPTKHVLFNTMQSVDFTLKALATNPNMGLRTDSLGAPNMHSMAAVDARLQSVWRTRPFFTEWATTGDPVVGRDQVKKFHISTTSSQNMRLQYDAMSATQKSAYADAVRSAGFRYSVRSLTVGKLTSGGRSNVSVSLSNDGVAPTYDTWQLQLRLTDANGNRVATIPVSADLQRHLPGRRTYSTSVRVPSIAPGTYTVSVAVADPQRYLADMQLGNLSRQADGGYPMGQVVVGR